MVGIASAAGAGSGAGMVSFMDPAASGAGFDVVSDAATGSAVVAGLVADSEFISRSLSSGGGIRIVTEGVRLPRSNVTMLCAVVLIQ